MHISSAHLHGHAGHSTSAVGWAAKRADETRKKLFSAAEELDAAATAESAWMIGAWGGSGGNGGEHGGSERRGQEPDDSGNGGVISEVVQEQNAVAGVQAMGTEMGRSGMAPGYAMYVPGERVERSAEVRRVSYWA